MDAKIRRYWTETLVLFAAVVLCYANTFGAPFQYDDLFYIQDNYAIFNPSHLKAIWTYWPTRFITYFTFALNYRIHAFSLGGYHAVNLAIHLINTLLLWAFLRLVFRTPAMRESTRSVVCHVPFFSALIFAVHPIQTQAVTYIYQRATCLAVLFCLLSLILYLQARLMPAGSGSRRMNTLYAVSFLSALLAMFTKEIAVALPLATVACEFFFFEGDTRRWSRLIPFLLLLFVIPVTAAVNHALTPATLAGAEDRAGMRFISQRDYLLTQCRALTTYIRLLLFPVNQNIDYDYPLAHSLMDLGVIAGIGLFLALTAAASLGFRRNRLVSFGLLWFLLTLLPQASIVPKPDLFIEHRLYLPSIGFIVAMVSLMLNARRIDHDRGGLFIDRIVTVLMLASAVILAVGTIKRNRLWNDRVALWDDAARKSPRKARPYLNRGLAYADRGDYAAAIADYSAALRLNPAYALAYCNRGVVYASLKDYPKAIADYSAALRLDSTQIRAYLNRGVVYVNKKDYTRAIVDYSAALHVKPDYVEAYCNRGVAHAMMKDYQSAFRDFDTAVKLNPAYAQAYNNRGVAHASAGDIPASIRDFSAAIRLDPRYAEAYKNRGAAFLLLSNYPAAAADFAATLRMAPQTAPELKPLIDFARKKTAIGR